MSVNSDVLYELEDKEEKEKREKEKREIEMYNFCDLALASIGLVIFSSWLVKKMDK